jgi:dipeptidyl aminopeptidase/acylaminoacyl peptidase
VTAFRNVAWILGAAVASSVGTATAATFAPRDIARIVDVSQAAISDDGRHVAFVASRAVLDTNSYRDELWVYDRPSGALRRIATRHDSLSGPAWSPDRKTLAVIANGPGDVDQLYTIAPNGSERRLTSGRTDVEAFAWRPDGRAIAFVRRNETPHRSGVAVYTDAFQVTDNDYLATANPQPRHLWLTTVSGGERRLTDGAWSVANSTITWSPNGASLAYLRVPNAIHGISGRAAAYALDIAGDTSRPLTTHDAHEDQIEWSPDGSRLLFLYPRDGDPAAASTVRFVDMQRRDTDASSQLDLHVDTAGWYPDGRRVLLKVYDVTSGPLFELAQGAAPVRLPLGPVVNAEIESTQSVSRDGTIAFVGTTADRPSELYLLGGGAQSPRRITDFNGALARAQLGRITTVRWTSTDGFQEAGVLTYPPDYVAGKQYPMVLRIHGGPAETSLAAFEPFYQSAAARGYLVFAPNYRGSTNLGNAFERAIFNDASVGPGNDIMAGIATVEKTGIVDNSRLAVSGWSYGGQMTSWMISHYDIWKCAVTGAAVNDLVVDYTIADDIDADRLSFSDSPFAGDQLGAWQRQSPITYFKNVHTPLLMMGNVYDIRVPIVEQYEFFHALRDNGVPVTFYAYPTTGHLPKGPVRLIDAYERWLSWFDRYLKP